MLGWLCECVSCRIIISDQFNCIHIKIKFAPNLSDKCINLTLIIGLVDVTYRIPDLPFVGIVFDWINGAFNYWYQTSASHFMTSLKILCNTWGPFFSDGSTLIPAWKSNHIHYKVWEEITYPFPNFSRWMNKWFQISPITFLGHVITYPCYD